MLQLSKERLEQRGAAITVREILGQPDLWREVFRNYVKIESEVAHFLAEIIAKHSYVRVIFTGAGSSQYVGDTVQRSLIELGDVQHFRFESIGSTDLVSAPQSTLERETPTLLVSFARSGDSPESVAAVEMVEDLVDNCYHLIITCAKEGRLARSAQGRPNIFVCILPDASNDQGFAMTGSCSSMILLATLIFSKETLEKKHEQLELAAGLSEDIFQREAEIVSYLGTHIKRLVYVGSGPLAALSREAQLKILELTAGKVATVFDSSMGLRHGPKSFIDGTTLVLVLCANATYTRQYDLDLYEEIKSDGIASKVVLVGQKVAEGFAYKSADLLEEAYLVLPALAFAHVVAINASLLVENTPDTPSASGTVNRVVKGVTIHKLESR